ncbi:MAG: two-component system, OmpR family, sensor kinase [Streptosporangiaceae bacterium]|jgi:two-component system OmpR family sensor kinase|nr:two-component system, OmpR family, sensor kinase [Streptosporangiaceae bacterium]
MSLRTRLALIFALGSGALVTVAGLAFVWQLHTSLGAALDSELRVRATALAAQLATGSLPTFPPASSNQSGGHGGQSPAAEQISQVLGPGRAPLYSSGLEGAAPLLSPAQLRRAATGPLTVTTVIHGERLRLLASEVRFRRQPAITVVAVPTDVADTALARARLALVIAAPLAVLTAGLGGWLLTGAALHPVARMRRRLEEITARDTGARLPVPGTGDEIAALAVTMNGLLDRLQQALARQRAFTADAGHELRTPLTALKAELELAARPGRSRDALAAAVGAAASDTDRLIRLAEDLLLLAGTDEGTASLVRERTDISSELHAAARRFATAAAGREVAISVQANGPLPVSADPGRMRQVLDNLLGNALRHAPPGSTVEMTGRPATAVRPGGGQRRVVAVEVRDHGPGFPPDFLPQAFGRFQRADRARSRADGGTGLGLAIVASIVRAHGGTAIAGNDPGGGARIRIELPLDSGQ